MRLNNKGFAISSIMYIILVMAILIITVTLSVLSSRKLILDKLKGEVSNKINQDIELSYKDTLKAIRIATQNYIDSGHSIDNTCIDSVSIDSLKSSNYLNVSDKVLNYYNLSDKYVGFKNNNSTYSFMIGQEIDYNDLKGEILDIVDYHIEGNSVKDGTQPLENPVEIQSVGQKTKNLLDIDSMLNENLIKNADDSYTIKKITSDERFSNTLKVNIPAGTYLSLSGEILEYNGTYDYSVQLALTFEDDTFATLGIANDRVWSEKYPKAIKGIRIYQEDSMPAGTYAKFKNLQLEIGDKKSSYEPYGYKIPIEISDKNLVAYPYIETTKTINGITLTDNGDGTITVNGTATANTIFNIEDNKNRIWTGIKQNKVYTISLSSDGNYSGNISFVVNYYPKDEINYSAWLSSSVGKSTSKACPEDISGLRSYIYIYSGAVFDNATFKPQLELSDEKTDYRPYVEPTMINIYLNEPLRKVGDYVDYVDFKTGKVVRNVGKTNLQLTTPIEETINLQNIVVKGGRKIEIDTSIKPSNATYRVIEKMFDIKV